VRWRRYTRAHRATPTLAPMSIRRRISSSSTRWKPAASRQGRQAHTVRSSQLDRRRPEDLTSSPVGLHRNARSFAVADTVRASGPGRRVDQAASVGDAYGELALGRAGALRGDVAGVCANVEAAAENSIIDAVFDGADVALRALRPYDAALIRAGRVVAGYGVD